MRLVANHRAAGSSLGRVQGGSGGAAPGVLGPLGPRGEVGWDQVQGSDWL